MKDINFVSMCEGCKFFRTLTDTQSSCQNPEMSATDFAEAVTDVFFGGECRGFKKIPTQAQKCP